MMLTPRTLVVFVAMTVTLASCADNSSYVRDAGSDANPSRSGADTPCGGLESLILDPATYELTLSSVSPLDSYRSLDAIDPQLSDLLVELNGVEMTEDGAARAVDIASELDWISFEACEVPLMSAIMAMLDAAMTETRCISGASGCGQSTLALPSSLPCFEASSRPVGVYELGFFVVDCASREPIRWDSENGEWIPDDDPFRERDAHLYGPGTGGDWQDLDDPECVSGRLLGPNGLLRAYDPVLVGGQIVALSDCSVVGITADGRRIDWEIPCDFPWRPAAMRSANSEVAVVECSDGLAAIDVHTGSEIWRVPVAEFVVDVVVGPGHVALNLDSGDVLVLEIASGVALFEFEDEHATAMALTDDKLFLADGSEITRMSIASGKFEASRAVRIDDMALWDGQLFVRTTNWVVMVLDAETFLPSVVEIGSDERNLANSYFAAADKEHLVLLRHGSDDVISVFDSATTEREWVYRGDPVSAAVGDGVVAVALESDDLESLGYVVLDADSGEELVARNDEVFGSMLIHDGWIYFAHWSFGGYELTRVAVPS